MTKQDSEKPADRILIATSGAERQSLHTGIMDTISLALAKIAVGTERVVSHRVFRKLRLFSGA
ncbi:MAG: hypothetical protein EON93_14785 [Burkholderiales bacterium]|nr:MAG: hypothetical protein EON93_14785 [Burkholderiales bacterium]